MCIMGVSLVCFQKKQCSEKIASLTKKIDIIMVLTKFDMYQMLVLQKPRDVDQCPNMKVQLLYSIFITVFNNKND